MSKISYIPPTAPSAELIAYTAGILDGEGSIQINPSKGATKRYWGLTVQISANGKTFLPKLREDWFGIGSVTFWKPRGRKLDRISGNCRLYGRHAEWLLCNLLQHLRIKQEQALVAIRFRKCIGEGKNTLTPEMLENRKKCAIEMRILNEKNGKATTAYRNTVGII